MTSIPSDDKQVRQDLTRQWTAVLPVLTAYVMSSIQDWHRAEDVVQEVGAVVSARFTEIPTNCPFNAWVLGIARNQIFKYYRTASRDRLVFSGEALDRLAAAFERLTDTNEEIQQSLDQCIELLTERSKRVLDLRYKQGMRVDRIADLLGSTANNVSAVLFRIRQSLRDCIDRRRQGQGVNRR